MSLSVSGWKRVPEQLKKHAYELWIENGSLSKTVKILEAEGWRNSSGKPYAEAQVSAQAKIYLLDNFETENLLESMNQDRVRQGHPILTQTEFEELLVLYAAKVWGVKSHASRFWNWIDEHEFGKYAYVWKDLRVRPRPINQPRGPATKEPPIAALQKPLYPVSKNNQRSA